MEQCVFTGPGSGQITVIGARDDDFDSNDGIVTPLAFLRLRARELCRWLKVSGKRKGIRSRSKDIMVSMVPQGILREGSSGSVAILLALLRLFLDCKLKARVAVTGSLSLNGQIYRVESIVDKVRAALDYDAAVILVPRENEDEVREHFRCKPASVVFVDTMVDVLRHAMEGE